MRIILLPIKFDAKLNFNAHPCEQGINTKLGISGFLCDCPLIFITLLKQKKTSETKPTKTTPQKINSMI
jgi:hypothetical protein